MLPGRLLEAENVLEVRRHSSLAATPRRVPGLSFGEIPHGKQSWYGPLGGIWQSVKLLARDKRHVSHVAIDANPDSGEVSLALTLSAAAAGATIRGHGRAAFSRDHRHVA